MNKIKQAYAASMAFANRHRIAVVAIPCTAAGVYLGTRLQADALKEAYEFIEAAGLSDKFVDSVPFEEIYA